MKLFMSNKPYIKLTTCDGGDWEILEVDCGESYFRSCHSLSNKDWINFLDLLGYEVEEVEISDEEMELL